MNLSVTLGILILTVLVSYQCFQNINLFDKLKHYPYKEYHAKEYYRMLTSGFVHGSWGHLMINMYVLYTFGGYVESFFSYSFGSGGRLIYLFFYLSAIAVADIPTYIQFKNNPNYTAVGASGAISGIVFIFILLNPWSQLSIIFLRFLPFPAILGGVVYLVYTTWASKNAKDNIGHSAHLWGALYGIAFVILLKPEVLTHFISELQAGMAF